ncbi:MAG: tRNA pseudouridine(38-40) synthase TruA [Nitrospirae bacterium]|nr:tRNA pseudouridine(38-40) synthase TruA [Nitrospirota bacterium]
MTQLRNIKLILHYDGTNYSGWQTQRLTVSPTIQGVIEGRIASITGGTSTLIAAGRTDKGVHSLGQVASFKTHSNLPAKTIKRALNATLPEDIRVISVSDVPLTFHPRYSALSKTYIYIINSEEAPLFLRRFFWRVPFELNLDDMQKAGEFLKGEHDFSAFRGSGCSSKNTIRNILSLDIKPSDRLDFLTWSFHGRLIKITITANAFLRHMVRNIIGTLVEVGRGMMSVELREVIASKDRRLAGPTAPPQGLFLEKVDYAPDFSTDASISFFS